MVAGKREIQTSRSLQFRVGKKNKRRHEQFIRNKKYCMIKGQESLQKTEWDWSSEKRAIFFG